MTSISSGISSTLPTDWHGRLFAWTGGPPTLELSTLPIERLPEETAIPNRERLGAVDVSIVLAENDTIDLGSPSTTLPLSIREHDRCDCEVLDDGTTPPDGHALFHRSFETGRAVASISTSSSVHRPSSAAREQAEPSSATIEIAGAPRAQPPAAPILVVPNDWFVQENPLPPLIEPRIIVAAGSYDFPRPALFACGVQPGLDAMPRTDVFLLDPRISGLPGCSGAGRHAAVAQTILDRPPPPSQRRRVRAAGAEDVRDYRFWANDHLVQVQVGIGAAAGPDVIAQLEQAVSSFDP